MLKHGLLSLWGSAKVYSTSTTMGYSSNGVITTYYYTTTYNATATYQANLASQQRLANFSQALQEEKNIKQMGYLKKTQSIPANPYRDMSM